MDPVTILAILTAAGKTLDALTALATVAIQTATPEQQRQIWTDLIATHARHDAFRQRLAELLHLPSATVSAT